MMELEIWQGKTNGCAANFLKVVSNAHYYHCASHSLNLALSKTCRLPEVTNMMSTLQALGIFFKFSPKRHQRLTIALDTVNAERSSQDCPLIKHEKVKVLCETRWVERHTTLEDFHQMYEAIIDCLDAIRLNEDS